MPLKKYQAKEREKLNKVNLNLDILCLKTGLKKYQLQGACYKFFIINREFIKDLKELSKEF